MKLIEKIQKMSMDITLSKDLSIGNYKAVGEAQVKEQVKIQEMINKVTIIPTFEIVGEPQMIEKISTYNGKENKSYQTSVFVKCKLKVYDQESEETIETVSFGQGIDSGDKAVGKANTYAYKYGLMNLFKTSTGDDEGGNEKIEQAKTMSMQQEVTMLFNEKLKNYDGKAELYKAMGISGKEFITDYKSGDYGKLESLKGLLEMS